MRIVKAICHLGVDYMLKEALDDHLTIARFRDPKTGEATDNTRWIADEGIPFPFTYDIEDEYDFKIIDDMTTYKTLKNIRARKTIWYIHGTYHKWPAFQQFWNSEVKYAHVLFPDEDRERYIKKWWKGRAKSKIYLPIHLSDKYFIEASDRRNGLSYSIGNNLYQTCNIYGGDFDETFKYMSELGTHIYGFNPKPPPGYPKELIKGAASPINQTVKDYSVSIHPSHVGTVGFALLEGIAAGVPAVCTHKPDLKDCPGVMVSKNPQSLARWAELISEDESWSIDSGLKGQEWLFKNRGIEQYHEKLLAWLESIK